MDWQLCEQNLSLQKELAGSLNVSPITAQVLINRGITTAEGAKFFLYPSLQQLHDPFLMADMEKAVNRVIGAIKKNEHITVFGDYDADGITSAAVMVKFLAMVGVHADYYIPNRISDGYGLNRRAIGELKERGTKLIITVDNGIGAAEETDYAASLGMDVIVTDHHEPKGRLPKAAAVVNPKRPDCKFPFKTLAGVGVVFNLVIALRQRMREAGLFANVEEPRLREFLDMVAIGTVADVMPLLDENRIFVKFGLEELKKSTTRGLNALKVISNLEPHQINAISVAFRIVPRLNAAGRIDDQNLGIRLLLTEDPIEAAELAQKLHSINSRRQTMEEGILNQANEMLKMETGEDLSIVLCKDGWHPGVVGIVAARLVSAHKKPSIVIGLSNGVGRGSARSVGNYNIVEALGECSDLLVNFGGHRHAAGVTIAEENIGAFKKRFAKVVNSTLSEDDRSGKIRIDAVLSGGHISERLISELEMLEPFGEGNSEPTFSMNELKVSSTRIVAEKHLKLKFVNDMIVLDAIGFDMRHHDIANNDILDVAFVPQRDTWRGAGAVQLKLRDLKQV